MLFILRRGRHEDKYATRLVSGKGGKKRKKKGKCFRQGQTHTAMADRRRSENE